MNKIKQSDKYRSIIRRAGLWNKVFGWLWLANGLMFAFLFAYSTISHSVFANLFSLVTIFGSSEINLAVIASLIFGVVFLYGGTYVRQFRGSLIGVFLFICGVISLTQYKSLIPLIPAIMSFYGMYAFYKLSRQGELEYQENRQPWWGFSLRELGLGLLFIVFSLIMLTVGLGRTHSTTSGVSASHKYFDNAQCSGGTSPATGCLYISTKDHYQVTFLPTKRSPTLFDSGQAIVFHSTAYLTSAATGEYGVDVFTFNKDVTTSTLFKLQESRNDANISCGTNPTTDQLTTYIGLPAIITDVAGTDSIENVDCHYFSTALAKNDKVYVIYGKDLNLVNGQRVTLDSFNTFLASFKLTN